VAQSSNLVVRLATGLIGAPLLLVLLYLAPPWAWLAFVVLAAAVGSFELFSMTHPGDRPAQLTGVVLTEAVIGLLWSYGANARVLLTLLVVMPILGMMLVLLRLGDIHTAAVRLMANAFGPLYVGGGLGAIVLLRRDGFLHGPLDTPHDGASFVVLAMLLSWFSDTGAYFAGRTFGKHKLYEAVSPKKTVEGAVGGLLGSLLGALLAHFTFLKALPLGHAVVLALVAGSLGQAGDLGESLIKRSFGVKDSGGILPGHGGILDRVDALLVTGIITYLYVLWVGHHGCC
jgi:phosphatidate cytidylyltransferase